VGKKHPTEVRGMPDMASLAREIAGLRYDKLVDFLDALSKKLHEDANADYSRGRLKLATRLAGAAAAVENATTEVSSAWAVCEPYEMKEVPKCGNDGSRWTRFDCKYDENDNCIHCGEGIPF
jgi:hypothetical protein